MVFNSVTFAVFFIAVYLAYVLARRRLVVQNALLLVSSLVFYGWWDWRFLGLIVVSTLTDYVCGLLIDSRRSAANETLTVADSPYRFTQRARRRLMWLSVGVNLGILGFFKYYDFFAASAAEALAALGLPAQPRLLNVVLPVGISFYTFQTLSYTIDIYQGKLRATRNLLDFAVFVTFFPQLVAGPIVRAADMLPQIARRRTLSVAQTYEGSYLILWGLFKKVVIADPLSMLVDYAFAPGAVISGGTMLVGVYAFAIQIYCDFSGYSDIARGCAKTLGFELCLNFELPYLATNPVEFWRRWHISLSTWLRDYVYIPLGGNRFGTRRTCINLMLTMLLGGLWHGAAWTFVLWGFYQGALLIAYKLMAPAWVRLRPTLLVRYPRTGAVIAGVAFFQFVCFGWLIFRAESLGHLGTMIATIGSPWPWWMLCGAMREATGVWALIAITLPLVAIQTAQWRRREMNALLLQPAWLRGVCYAGMIYGILLFGGRFGGAFIYFQF